MVLALLVRLETSVRT